MIEFRNISFSFGRRAIFRKINFSVQKNHFTSIIGHNGSGKTTLIKLMMGFLRPDDGSILINGIDIDSKEFKKGKNTFGYISQGSVTTSLPVTVKEVIQMASIGNRLFGEKEYHQIISAFSLTHMEYDLYRNLSGGQKQRVNIARCVAQEPDIIFLDEPDAFLDPHAQHEILELIKEINTEKKITIVMITHDFQIVEKYSDRIFRIENLGISEVGQPSLTYGSRKV